jgi:hypothetical protein
MDLGSLLIDCVALVASIFRHMWSVRGRHKQITWQVLDLQMKNLHVSPTKQNRYLFWYSVHYFSHLRSKFPPQHPFLTLRLFSSMKTVSVHRAEYVTLRQMPKYNITLRLCSPLNAKDQISHPYRSTGQIIVLYIPLVMFLGSRWQDKRFWTDRQQALPEFNFLFTYPPSPPNKMMIRYSRSAIFVMGHSFKGSVSSLCHDL